MASETLIQESLSEHDYICDTFDVSEYDTIHLDVSADGSVFIGGWSDDDA